MTVEMLKTQIIPALERKIKKCKETGNKDLQEDLIKLFKEYEKMSMPLEAHKLLNGLSKQVSNIQLNEPNKKKKSSIKRKIMLGGLSLLLAGCTLESMGGANSKNDEEIPVTVELDISYWNRKPLTGTGLIEAGTNTKMMFAENGLYEDGKFSNYELAFYAFMNGIEARTDSRIVSAKLSEIVADRKAAQSMLEKRMQSIETGLMGKEFTADWNKVYAKKYEANILNEFQKVYENVVKEDTVENRNAIVDLLNKITENATGYGVMASLDIITYVNTFRNFGANVDKGDNSYITEDLHDVFVNHMYKNCLDVNTETEEFKKEQHTLYNDTMIEALETVEEILVIEKDTQILSDKDMSLAAVGMEISKVKVENKTFDGLTIDEKASEESAKDAQTDTQVVYPGETVTSDDVITTDSTGREVIDSGVMLPGNSVGEELPPATTDNNGNQTDQGHEDLIDLGVKGAQDYYSLNGGKDPKYANDSAYLAGWNAAKELDDSIDNSEKAEIGSEDIIYPNNPDAPKENDPAPKEEAPAPKEDAPKEEVTEQPKEEASEPIDPDLIIGEEITTNDGYYSNFDIGTDEKLYDRETGLEIEILPMDNGRSM